MRCPAASILLLVPLPCCPFSCSFFPHPQAKRETNDDRQREYEAKLKQYEKNMDQARQVLSGAESNLAAVQEQKAGLRGTIEAKEGEVKQLQQRWVRRVWKFWQRSYCNRSGELWFKQSLGDSM